MDESQGPWAREAAPSHERIRAALHRYATEFLLLLTPKGELVASSAPAALGYRGDERVGHHIAEHLHPDDLPVVYDIIERARATKGFEEKVSVRAQRADGSWGWFEATVIDATDDPDLRGAVLRVREVTEEVDAEERAAADARPAPDRFLSLAEALPLGILSADARGAVVFCNEAAQQILNLDADQLYGRAWEGAVHPEDLPGVVHAAGNVVVLGQRAQVTFRVQTGLFPRWAHATFVPLGDDRRNTGWIATIEDITDRRRAESRLAHQATHDPLTNLPNRTLLEDRLGQACGRLRRGSQSVTVFFIDLDLFKDVNDRFGHRAGDQVLVEVARRLGEATRDVDTVARLGGDEFVVVCENLPLSEVGGVATRIEDVLSVSMLLGGEAVRLGASVGSITTTDAAAEPGQLLAEADQDMYRQKERRRSASG